MDSNQPLHALPDALFHHAVEQSAIAIAITDEDARVLYVNAAFCAITGYSAEEILGSRQSVLSYKRTPDSVYKALWGALNAGRDWTGRLLNRRKDGSPYVAELTVTAIRQPGDEGEAVRYLAMHRDVTEEHRQACQLANHKQLIESVISVAPMAVALLDQTGKVVLDNPAYMRALDDLGVSEPAHAVMDALHETLGEKFEYALAHRRVLLNHELRFERPGAEPRWYACSLAWFEERPTAVDAYYQNTRGNYSLLVMHDISATRRQQEALRLSVMRERLSEREFNESLREALAGAIFQVQGPINLIAAAASLQRRRAGVSAAIDPLVHALAEAQEAGERAIATLQAAMPHELSAPTSLVNLNEVLRDVLMLETETLLSAGVTVDWRPAMVLPTVQGDPAALRTLFRLLLTNAVEAMNVRGLVERTLSLSTSARAGEVEVQISDSGPGIPEEIRLKVFEPFFSTKQAQKGARGVGLSLAQEVVNRHRGVLEIDATYTAGCRLKLSFPATRPATLEAESSG